MAGTYLRTAYRDRERVKSLGARWDADQRSWYVPDGQDLVPFEAWLPDALPKSAGAELALGREAARQGVSLSQLLAGVSQVVAAAYRSGVWTRVEVVKVDARRGHVYLELTERSADGGSLAQARAMIWADTANTVVPQFEQATGAVLGPGIKLLVRAKPTVHPQYGLSLVIDAIDPEYTLGDLEARKREIRDRLKREGLFDLNRRLTPPWDYNAVVVVAPQGAAGLGDFEAEAGRLQQFGLCDFGYVHSRFQGEGAATEIRAALMDALDNWRSPTHRSPDAVAIIRGGGAVNDLAWLNDYTLARCLCELDVPVLTGIGHERDSTILDEVAHQRFDTPSKVIAGIEQRIRQRAEEARGAFEWVAHQAQQLIGTGRRSLDRQLADIQLHSRAGLAITDRRVEQGLADVRQRCTDQLRRASDSSAEALAVVRTRAHTQVADARSALEAGLGTVRLGASDTLARAGASVSTNIDAVLHQTAHRVQAADEAAERGIDEVGRLARQTVDTAANKAEALVREVAGQGPEKTLGRGFAVVRAADGRTLTRAADVGADLPIRVQFNDGTVGARTSKGEDAA